jgi:hypothetical protein
LIDVQGVDFVLKAPPQSITVSKHNPKTTRSVIVRVSLKDYEVLERAATIAQPTQEDLDALGDAVANVFGNVPKNEVAQGR